MDNDFSYLLDLDKQKPQEEKQEPQKEPIILPTSPLQKIIDMCGRHTNHR